MNVEDACEKFLDYCARERHLAPNTIAAYRQDLIEFRCHFPGRDVGEIVGDELVAYSQHLASTRRLAPATIKRRLACLRAMFSRLVRQRAVRESPFASVDLRIRIPTRLPRCLGAADVGALMRATERACETTRLTAVLLFATGVRVSELAAVRVEDVDLEQRSLRIFGKGSRERQVFLPNDGIVAQVRAYVAARHQSGMPSDGLLINARGRPISSSSLRNRIKALAKTAGLIQRVTPHVLRHTAATALMESGVDIRFVQRLLGHQSIATTQIYTHVSDVALRTAIVSANVLSRFGSPTGAAIVA